MTLTSKVVRRPVQHIPPQSRVTSPDGLVIEAPPGAPASPVVLQQSDGTEVLVPGDLTGRQVNELTPADPARDIDALTALQIGMASLIGGMDCYDLDVSAHIKGDVKVRQFRPKTIVFDFPRVEDLQEPRPLVCIAAPGKHEYDQQGLDITLLEETLDVFAPRTVLRKLASFTCTLQVTIFSGHKDIRRGLKAAIERTFLASATTDQQGRRVPVPLYFDQVARYTLVDTEYPDTGDGAQQNDWAVQANFTADIDRVLLVHAPPSLQRPAFSLEVSDTLTTTSS